MALLYEIQSNYASSFEFALPFMGSEYLINEAKRIDLHHQIAWCQNCESIKLCERLRTEVEIYGELLSTRMGNPTQGQVIAMLGNSERLARAIRPMTQDAIPHYESLMHELDLIRDRESPARCLDCEHNVIVEFDAQGALSLDDGREFACSVLGHAQMYGNFGLYSREGIRLGDSEITGPV